MNNENELIIKKLKEIKGQGKLEFISMVSSINSKRLNEIIEGKDITIPEKIILKIHLKL